MSTPTLDFVKGITAIADKPLYTMGADGMVSRIRISAEFLGACDTLFSNAFVDAKTGIANVLPNTHIWGSKSSYIVFRHLTELTFNTGWVKDPATETWSPKFKDVSTIMRESPTAIAANAAFTWDIKALAAEDMWAILIYDSASGQVYLAFEVLFPDDKSKWIKPPFGNIYNDGTVCMGSGFTTGAEFLKLPVASRLLNIQESINASVWNSDLITQESKTLVSNLFKFNGDKVNTVTPKEQAELIRASGVVINTPILTKVTEACDALDL